jgi:hypothetical protein
VVHASIHFAASNVPVPDEGAVNVPHGGRHVDRVQAALQRRRLRDGTIRAFVDDLENTTSTAL